MKISCPYGRINWKLAAAWIVLNFVLCLVFKEGLFIPVFWLVFIAIYDLFVMAIHKSILKEGAK